MWYPQISQNFILVQKAWGGTLAAYCDCVQLPYWDSKVFTVKKAFLALRNVFCVFVLSTGRVFFKLLLLSLTILFLPMKCLHSVLVRSSVTFIWCLQGNLLPEQIQSKSEATLRSPWWMKLQYKSIMLRIMIPLPLSIEIRGTSLQCRILILLTFFIDF